MKNQDLIRLNPDVEGGLKADSYIVVPEKKLIAYKANKENNTSDVLVEESSTTEVEVVDEKLKLINELKERFVVHEVQKGETFFNLHKLFNVTRGQLLILKTYRPLKLIV